jgi:hypothetical protein
VFIFGRLKSAQNGCKCVLRRRPVLDIKKPGQIGQA